MAPVQDQQSEKQESLAVDSSASPSHGQDPSVLKTDRQTDSPGSLLSLLSLQAFSSLMRPTLRRALCFPLPALLASRNILPSHPETCLTKHWGVLCLLQVDTLN